MVDRFATTLDCVDLTFIGDQFLDQLPAPAQIGATRVGRRQRTRIRAALSAITEFTAKVHAQAAYDLRKLRGKNLITKPGRTKPDRWHHRRPADLRQVRYVDTRPGTAFAAGRSGGVVACLPTS